MILFQEPWWLLVLLPAGLLFWLTRPATPWLFGLRFLVVLFACLALAQPSWKTKDAAGYVVVVADRSLSMPTNSLSLENEMVQLLDKEMGREDRLAVVAFGEEAMVERPPSGRGTQSLPVETGGEASRLAEAVDRALALIPEGEAGRVLVVSDGRFTGESPFGAAFRAAARGIPLDHRLIARAQAGDLAIERVTAPQSVPIKEGFMVSAFVRAPAEMEAQFEFMRDGKMLSSGKRLLAAGINRLVFRDRLEAQGAAQYTLRVTAADVPAGAAKPAADPIPENNTARLLVTAQGRPPVLLVTRTPGGGLRRLLEAGGLDPRTVRPEEAPLDLAQLSGVSAVILENIAAAELPGGATDTLAQWVRQGGGLLMTGGRKSFGPGGYFKGPLDPILPVSMELRQEHRKMSLSMAIEMDCSGSMGAPCAGKTKMDMANLGAAQVVELLSPMDELGISSVDTSAHNFVAFGPNSNPVAAAAKTRSIGVGGGGIFIDVALDDAHDMLKRATSSTRHLILFADACDSEQPGDYHNKLADMRKDGITVSVIGMGKETDPDSALLKDIAKLGGGNIYFAEDPTKIPQFFAQDTFTVARSTFVEEKTAQKVAAGLTLMTGRAAENMPEVGGYNLTYLKDGAVLASVTDDDYKAPVCAAWRVEAGRVAVFTGEADGKYSGPMGKWEGSGHFFSSLARFVAAKDAREFAVTQDIEGSVARVRVHLAPDRKDFGKKPLLGILQGTPGREPLARTQEMQWEDADTLVAAVPMKGSATTLCAVSMEDAMGEPVRLQLPPLRLPYPPEFAPAAGATKAGAETLSRLSQATGGLQRDDLGTVWKDIPRRPRAKDWAPWLLCAACALFLLEVLERRTALVSAAGGLILAFVLAPLAAIGRWRRAVPVRQPEAASAKPKSVSPSLASPASGVVSDPMAEWRAYAASQKAKEAPSAGEAAKKAEDPAQNDGVLGALGAANKKRRK